MSLYKESEKALSELNDVISTIKDSKEKLNVSADNMTKALTGFIELNKPLYTIVQKDLDLDKVVKSSSDDVRSEMASLKGALLRDIEKSVELVTESTQSFNSSLKSVTDSVEQGVVAMQDKAEQSESKVSKLISIVILLVLANLGVTSFLLSKIMQ